MPSGRRRCRNKKGCLHVKAPWRADLLPHGNRKLSFKKWQKVASSEFFPDFQRPSWHKCPSTVVFFLQTITAAKYLLRNPCSSKCAMTEDPTMPPEHYSRRVFVPSEAYFFVVSVRENVVLASYAAPLLGSQNHHLGMSAFGHTSPMRFRHGTVSMPSGRRWYRHKKGCLPVKAPWRADMLPRGTCGHRSSRK